MSYPSRKRLSLASAPLVAWFATASFFTPTLAAEPPPPAAIKPLTDAASTPKPDSAAAKKAQWKLFGTLRLREELWSWFDSSAGDSNYAFTAALLRFGATRSTLKDDLTLELAVPAFLDLPHGSSLPPPIGQLGHGASYQDANPNQDASLFVKQAFWRRKGLVGPGSSLRLGRFEFNDGQETTPADPSLAWLKQQRISQRLLGTFGFTHVGRSFDALEFNRQTGNSTLTFFGGIPTRGVFDLHGMDTLPGVRVAYLALTKGYQRARFQADSRLFGIYYDDVRDGVLKADNRPLPTRLGDSDSIRLGTLGGHGLAVWDLPAGKLDALLWGGGQFGSWGDQSHSAYALAAEVGFQPKGVWGRPWFRAGFNRYSGDDNPLDGKHTTWMPLLPTPRPYARFPFFTEMNLNDAFGQALLRPGKKVTVRPEIHFLSLAEENDLWYAGGGAFQDRPSFGYAGRPGGGNSYLGTLADVSVDYQWRKNTSLTAYVGHITGGGVVKSTFTGREGWFGYLEVNHRF